MEAVNLLSSNKYTEKQIVRIRQLELSSWMPMYLLGLPVHFCHHEFEFGNEAAYHSEYSQ